MEQTHICPHERPEMEWTGFTVHYFAQFWLMALRPEMEMIDWLNGFYGALFCTILADGAEVLDSSSESPAGQRWPTKYKQYLRMLDPQSPFY
jgi:hypothetical protein